jgi:hypothetical protein
MKSKIVLVALIFGCILPLSAQNRAGGLWSLTQPHNYVEKRSSSYDRTGGNADYRRLAPGQTLVLLDAPGPGAVMHVWMTIASSERYHLKKLVLRMYWDGERTPSVETPVGDFFGLGLGEYNTFESVPLAVAPDNALNCFFPMPFQKHALIRVTNEGQEEVNAFYFNIDYRDYSKALSARLRRTTGIPTGPSIWMERTITSGWMRGAAGNLQGLRCPSLKIRTDGGVKATICFLWTAPSCRRSRGQAPRIFSWARGILEGSLFPTACSERPLSAKN